EAEQDRLLELQKQNNPAAPAPEKQSGLFGSIFANLVIGSANAQAATRSDETVITLKPNEGVEYKLTMRAGAKVNFAWTSTGPVNADLHGTDP
ncbi:hypothetical protein NL373_27705, partial [Klebsiella pneumoniae]|nr:hypothetical protein [Klebsiella pneumoniae]